MCCVDERNGNLLYTNMLVSVAIRHHVFRVLFTLIKVRQWLILEQVKLTLKILNEITCLATDSTIVHIDILIADNNT
jgi:hypothetical protein